MSVKSIFSSLRRLLCSRSNSQLISLGQWGEQHAAEHYRKLGATIVGRNVRIGRGEIDLIVSHQQSLIFVEVKTRHSHQFGEGWEAVNRNKQMQISRLAVQFLKRHPHPQHHIRFDLISITKSNSAEFELKHFANAFESTC